MRIGYLRQIRTIWKVSYSAVSLSETVSGTFGVRFFLERQIKLANILILLLLDWIFRLQFGGSYNDLCSPCSSLFLVSIQLHLFFPKKKKIQLHLFSVPLLNPECRFYLHSAHLTELSPAFNFTCS